MPLKFQLTLAFPDEELELLDEDELLEDELELDDELLEDELDEELELLDEFGDVPPHAAIAASSPSKMRHFMWHPLMFWICHVLLVPQRPGHHKTIGQARKRVFASRELSCCEIVISSPNAARRYCILRYLLSFSASGWPGRYHW